MLTKGILYSIASTVGEKRTTIKLNMMNCTLQLLIKSKTESIVLMYNLCLITHCHVNTLMFTQ